MKNPHKHVDIDLNKLPKGWFLDGLIHVHTTIVKRGDKHEPQYWVCHLQHVTGGIRTTGQAPTANCAYAKAVKYIASNWTDDEVPRYKFNVRGGTNATE